MMDTEIAIRPGDGKILIRHSRYEQFRPIIADDVGGQDAMDFLIKSASDPKWASEKLKKDNASP